MGFNRFLFLIFISILLSGCVTRSVLKLNADKYHLEPQKILCGSDGSLSIESELVIEREGQLDRIRSYGYASSEVMKQSIRNGVIKKIRGDDGKKKMVISLKIIIESPQVQDSWRLFTPEHEINIGIPTDIPNRTEMGQTVHYGDIFDYSVSGKTYAIQVESMKLASDISRGPKRRVGLSQALLFVPAVVADVLLIPVKVWMWIGEHSGTRVPI